MEENVALDSSKQKEFVKGIKKIIKKKANKTTTKTKDNTELVKNGKVFKKYKPKKGLVYISHIPHGFYEEQMSDYFKQFGVVTNVRVIRSKRTGNSKGFAFVEFREPAVAEIVADTMNNYLMGKRLLKAEVVPHEKQRRYALRKNWNNHKNPASDARQKMKNIQNAIKTEKEDLKIARKLLANISNTKKRLSEIGINYDFFAPVDVPDALQTKIKNESTVSPKTQIVKETNNKVDVKSLKKETGTKNKIKLEMGTKKNNKKSSGEMVIKNDESKKTVKRNRKNKNKTNLKTTIKGNLKEENKLCVDIEKVKKNKSLVIKRKNK